MKPANIDLKNPYLAAFLAWFMPGLGHVYQGRRGKGVLYFVCIFLLYAVGLYLGEGKIVYWKWVNPLRNAEEFRLAYLSQFWVGLGALPALLQATLAHWNQPPILGGFLAEPPLHVINELHRLGKFLDVGTVYTEIAGLLNILAIYDAFEGPAPELEPEPTPVAAANASMVENGV